MSLLGLTYSDSEQSDSDISNNDEDRSNKKSNEETNNKSNANNSNPKKRKFSEMSNDNDGDIQKKKKKRKIKLLPSAKNALDQSNKLQVDDNDNNKLKQAKIDNLISNHSSKIKSNHNDNHDDTKRKLDLQKNQMENQKYVKQQLKILANAEKENKLKKLTKETSRQKNSRKQKLGQATFTLKWDRDTGAELAGV